MQPRSKAAQAATCRRLTTPRCWPQPTAREHLLRSYSGPGSLCSKGSRLPVFPLLRICKLAPIIEEGIVLGWHRILMQDLEFGVAQIVEIAIRALSPAVNDTFTGVACTDLLGEALMILAEMPQHSNNWYGEDGSLRLRVRPLPVARLIKQAFDQVRQAASGTPAISIRLLATIGQLASKLERQQDRTALIEQADAVLEIATLVSVAGMDREDITAAWRKTRAACELGSYVSGEM